MIAEKEAWINSTEASEIITANSGHPVSDAYIRRLGLNGKITTKLVGKRFRLYNRAEVEAYRVKQRGTRMLKELFERSPAHQKAMENAIVAELMQRMTQQYSGNVPSEDVIREMIREQMKAQLSDDNVSGLGEETDEPA